MTALATSSDGLGLVSEGKELALAQLPERNPERWQLALLIYPSAVRQLHLGDGAVVEDLERVRSIVHSLQRGRTTLNRVYAHDWDEGDFALFYSRGTLHFLVGAFVEDEVRLFRQCNVVASEFPVGPLPEGTVAA
ncbi:hypothetical protein B0T26DRAFT_738035 [Lasiosphaeria miniovina]|uniref:Uncharacterized protein n=1 Tax=Lasiosphaeria miniovina TaxID=1954250 RepID=A0AA40E4Z7_9PEZI|nr:uncharacterized protein B0T26DRAFT_738035 [Lasiosphaeria miniovina]KAK0727295.1 hypothetical protein B0T26DRAFT_738035 [Lasiosphaeria miniovina]